jgi:hypothetical protein
MRAIKNITDFNLTGVSDPTNTDGLHQNLKIDAAHPFQRPFRNVLVAGNFGITLLCLQVLVIQRGLDIAVATDPIPQLEAAVDSGVEWLQKRRHASGYQDNKNVVYLQNLRLSNFNVRTILIHDE